MRTHEAKSQFAQVFLDRGYRNAPLKGLARGQASVRAPADGEWSTGQVLLAEVSWGTTRAELPAELPATIYRKLGKVRSEPWLSHPLAQRRGDGQAGRAVGGQEASDDTHRGRKRETVNKVGRCYAGREGDFAEAR